MCEERSASTCKVINDKNEKQNNTALSEQLQNQYQNLRKIQNRYP